MTDCWYKSSISLCRLAIFFLILPPNVLLVLLPVEQCVLVVLLCLSLTAPKVALLPVAAGNVLLWMLLSICSPNGVTEVLIAGSFGTLEV